MIKSPRNSISWYTPQGEDLARSHCWIFSKSLWECSLETITVLTVISFLEIFKPQLKTLWFLLTLVNVCILGKQIYLVKIRVPWIQSNSLLINKQIWINSVSVSVENSNDNQWVSTYLLHTKVAPGGERIGNLDIKYHTWHISMLNVSCTPRNMI